MIPMIRCLVAGFLLAALAPAWAASEAGPRIHRVAVEDTTTARVIVKYRSDSGLMRAQSAGAALPRPLHAGVLGQRLGLALTDRWVLGPRTQSLSAQGIDAAELARRIAALPDVEWAVPVKRKVINAALPNDPYYSGGQTTITPIVGQWYLRSPDNTIVSAIDAAGAWSLTTGSAAVTVAVLDTGVRFDHPDLQGKLWPGYDFIADIPTAGDGSGRDSDASDPGDWTTASSACGSSPSSWHGTQTAGLIGAASDNGIGMAGVGRDVMVLPVRVLGKCGGFDDDIIAAMRWAAGTSSDPVVNSHPARVINMSLGSTGACDVFYIQVFNEMAQAGVTVVVAAGNEEGLAVGTPANCPGAIAVGGLRHIGTKVGYSDVGPEITISAPAGNCVNLSGACLYPILTTTNSGRTTPSTHTYTDSFDYSVGTSFSAPLVAGTAGLMLSVDPTLSPARIKSAIQASARAFPTAGADATVTQCHAPNAVVQDECYCTTSTCGAGLLDAAAAVAAVARASLPPVAVIATKATAGAGESISLDGGPSSRTVVSYQWSLVAGAAIASFSSSTTAAATTLATSGTGTVTVRLMVTDSFGVSATTDSTITVVTGPVAIISAPSTTLPETGTNVALSGAESTASAGRTLSSYQWQIVAGTSLASFDGPTDGPTATLATAAAGSVTVQLTVVDSVGVSSSTRLTLEVQPVASAGGHGGGALSALWIELLALATLVLAWPPRRGRRGTGR